MNNALLKPRTKRKHYHMRLGDIRTPSEREHNAFSFPPKKGEKWYRYPDLEHEIK